jgi:hypothetical protein
MILPNPNVGIRKCQIQMMALERTISESWPKNVLNPDVDKRTSGSSFKNMLNPDVGGHLCVFRF